jgi:hypothetical protein
LAGRRSAQNLIKTGLVTFSFNEWQNCPSNRSRLCCIFRACSPDDAALIRNGDTTTNFYRRTVINKTGAAGEGLNGCHLEQLDERGITGVAAF